MDVTRLNFQEVLLELDNVLENASFLCIDGEFTGLNCGPDPTAFDTPAQYYTKLRSGSMNFLLVQFGLSVFTFDKEVNRYNQRSYNFYVFPRPLNRGAPDCRFICQASCIAFLAKEGFDFNKLFNSGIPYLTSIEEERLRKKVEEKQRIREKGLELVPIPDHDKPQIEEICSRIEEFISSEAKEFSIDRCNAFIRRILHQEARKRWPKKVNLELKLDGPEQIIVVSKVGTEEEEKKKETERREKEEMEIKEAVGLSAVLRKIVDSGKMIVGHNMLFDLCHIIRQFFSPLPDSYPEFKALVHGLFPRILDTKVISQSPQFKEKIASSHLAFLLDTLNKPPFTIPEITPIKDRSYSTKIKKCHEAGYDAYITGLCLISMCNYLGSLEDPPIDTVLPDSSLLNPFVNKLLIARLKDVPYINLVGKDPIPSRDHVFHLTFPKDWKINDVSKLFTPYGGVFVSWLSDTSAYVSLNKREQIKSVIKNVLSTNSFTIKKYSEYQTTLRPESSSEGLRKRKITSPEHNLSPKNGSEKHDEDGWEVASGKRRRKRKVEPSEKKEKIQEKAFAESDQW